MEQQPFEKAAWALRMADSCDFFEAENKDYAGMVRAVLDALCEPSEAMLDAGDAVHDFDDSLSADADAFNRRVVGRIWRAMVAAAQGIETRSAETRNEVPSEG